MRIAGGQFKGRGLVCPPGLDVRPTTDKTRQAIFNILMHSLLPQQGQGLEDLTVLDVFCGSGALGLEALSRGAKTSCFIDAAENALKACRDNIQKLGLEGQSLVLKRDATKPGMPPETLAAAAGLVFLDPPYGKNLGAGALAALAEKGWLAPHALCVLETGKKTPETLPAGFIELDARSYGMTRIQFLQAPF